jgi:TPR repeat protein
VKSGAPVVGVVITQVNMERHAKYGYGDVAQYYERRRLSPIIRFGLVPAVVLAIAGMGLFLFRHEVMQFAAAHGIEINAQTEAAQGTNFGAAAAPALRSPPAPTLSPDDSPASVVAPAAPKPETTSFIGSTGSTGTTEPRTTGMENAALLARGDTLLSIGDIASARLFYERAADAGDGLAAVRLGETFDPIFLERAGLSRVRGDWGAAVSWYRRARDLGATDAEVLLKGLGRN